LQDGDGGDSDDDGMDDDDSLSDWNLRMCTIYRFQHTVSI